MELFNNEAMMQESPRLEWLKKHKISTHDCPDFEELGSRWSCWSGDLESAIKTDSLSYGPTESEAIAQWAIDNKIPLWNEQQFVREKK